MGKQFMRLRKEKVRGYILGLSKRFKESIGEAERRGSKVTQGFMRQIEVV
jgi:hypothetical protein